jgi:hypothetical protein
MTQVLVMHSGVMQVLAIHGVGSATQVIVMHRFCCTGR